MRPTATITVFLLLSAIQPQSHSTPVDNAVEGAPEIECGPTSINVDFNTKNPFEGHVYVKGLFVKAECRSDDHGKRQAGISLPFGSCGIRRTRSLNPRGLFVSTVVIISFHPQFVTKVDRAYQVSCFYMEAEKTVTTDLEVSMLTSQFQTENVPMPTCRYEILTGGPQGQPVKFATIGQAVYHKWSCDTEFVNVFCARVYSCFVDDGFGDKVILLDELGCAQDKYLLNNLDYPTDLMAGQEAHVFKYADRTALYFQCQIAINVKEPKGECQRPKCPSPPLRGKRGAELNSTRISIVPPDSVMDVFTTLTSVDIEYPSERKVQGDQVCLSTVGLSALVVSLAISFLAAVTSAIWFRLKHGRK